MRISTKYARGIVAAATVAAAVVCALPATAQAADHTFQRAQTFNLNSLGATKNTVFVSAYGDESTTWYGYQKMAVSKYYASVYTSAGIKASRSRVTPEIKISGVSLSVSASGGSFSVVSNACVAATSYSAVNSDYAKFQHDGVACTGDSVDLTSITATNRAAVQYGGGWYGYTVTASFY
ncbi:hypothetical protein ACQPXM_31415 [Kribbella sp. CA-253562]|uniref:hypothetical protein n=1 Tax=Kribbella sp. CA-253562 TaxID=3239942 RepID=UPI003D8EFAA1